MYDYTDDNGDNNGNVMGITNNLDSARSFTYTYDQLNRIKTAATSAGTATYTPDIWGNLHSISLSGTTPWQNALNVAINPATNRISGNSYDDAGNMTGDGLYSYTYNAENQQTQAAGVTYKYDGDGKRVQKVNGTLYWYGAGSDVLSETDSAGGVLKEYIYFGGKRIAYVYNSAVYFYFSDHLGSSRVVTYSIGTICSDADFGPYGKEQTFTSTCSQNYKFTGKERDTETGNDYFGARYYENNLGRFLSPDNGSDQHPANPQSWNLYPYVRNNPLVLVDPSGDYVCGDSMTAAQCDQFQGYLNKAQEAANKLKDTYGADSTQYKDAQRAVDAYGKENVANGVTVNIGATGGYPGMTEAHDGATKTDLNPTGQNIQVTINSDLFRSGDTNPLATAVAHEGSHVGDAEDWARAGFTDAASPTIFNTEYRAYGVTTGIFETFGATVLSGSHGGVTFPGFWNKGATDTYNNLVGRPAMIKMFYPNWAEKAFQKNTHGGGE